MITNYCYRYDHPYRGCIRNVYQALNFCSYYCAFCILQVHIIVGIGDLTSNLPGNRKGVMADRAASPNDPLFVHHHGMVDCILEEWLQENSNVPYPDNIPATLKGHRAQDYIIPFFPLVKHQDMYKTGENFGFSCTLSDIPGTSRGGSNSVTLKPLVLIGALGVFFLSFISLTPIN